ncbi:MaoC family dehydratase [Rhizobium glycinendophyticum]|uniref:Acyl dehydratase n=1 Tax=Rhizobium glycinendophyticum TaxID=2589807 RepID=A0A504UIW4_9HYPH|nr:MaoC family dehydratase [Rhizobium glycinendophyticum]TPP05013.1 acyl dehydratase [Rhizobium glycinendophyticum]
MEQTRSAARPIRLAEARIQTSAMKTARYAELTADFNPIHVDPGFATNTVFGGPINHGTLGLSLLAQAIETTFGCVPHELDVRFSRPAPVGSVLVTGGEVNSADGSYHVHVTTEDGVRVIEGTLRLND